MPTFSWNRELWQWPLTSNNTTKSTFFFSEGHWFKETCDNTIISILFLTHSPKSRQVFFLCVRRTLWNVSHWSIFLCMCLLFNERLFFLPFHFTSKHALMHLLRAVQKAIHAAGIDWKGCRTEEMFSWGFLMEPHCDESQASYSWLIMLLTIYKSLSLDTAQD